MSCAAATVRVADMNDLQVRPLRARGAEHRPRARTQGGDVTKREVGRASRIGTAIALYGSAFFRATIPPELADDCARVADLDGDLRPEEQAVKSG